jgi:hypothetical protein
MQEEARYYRAQAQICIALAGQVTDEWVVGSLHEMAAEYISFAAKLEAVETVKTANRKRRLGSEPS